MRHSIFYILTIVILLIPLILIGFACRDEESEILPPPRPHPATIQLTAEDVGVTDVMLKISIAQDPYPRTFTLKRDTTIVLTTTLTSPDTLIFDEGLLPKHTYKYTLIRLKGQRQEARQRLEEIKNISITTMDTTSHNFTWQVDTLGSGSSVLFDVAIINDTSVWVVGELHARDSTGQTITYNAAHWNGRQWELLRVPTAMYGGSIWYYVIRTIIAFSDKDVWTFSNAGSYSHWDGQQWKTEWVAERSGGGTKLWGTSSLDLYLVGTGGSISHFNGQNWQKQESGTDVDLLDVWGTPDGSQVWACGYRDQDGASVILARTVTHSWYTIWNRLYPTPPYIYRSYISSLWTSGKNEFILTGGEVYRHSLIKMDLIEAEFVRVDSNRWQRLKLGNFAYRVRGSARNNIFVDGDDAMIWHFNGASWHKYYELINSNDRLYGLAVSDDIVVVVGRRYIGGLNRSGLIMTGRRL